MANEAHDGLARSVRTRVIGARMIRAANQAGVRRLAMEALHWLAKDVPGPITALPADAGGYLAQPEMRAMIGTALDLGWTLWAYETQFEVTPETDRDWLRSLEFTNRREREQAEPVQPARGGAGGTDAGLVRQRPRVEARDGDTRR
jgi:hypothetical protein